MADGQENAVPTFLVPKLYEVQKFMTLDGHFYSINSVIVQDKWYKSLPKELQTAIDQAAFVSTVVNRGVCTALEQKGIKFIQEKGMKVYAPTAKEKETFKVATQKPVVEFLKTKVDKAWIEKAFKATERAEKELGYASAAPVPSPRRMSRSTIGRIFSYSKNFRWPGSALTCAKKR